jgi:hypothetical protein
MPLSEGSTNARRSNRSARRSQRVCRNDPTPAQRVDRA